MAQALQHFPTSDDRIARKRLRGADLVVRAAVAELTRQELRPGTLEPVEDVVRRRYGRCEATLGYIERSAVNPAMTTIATWASELVGTAVLDFFANDMVRTSGFAQLAQRALVVPFAPGIGSVKIPARSSPLTLAGAWVGEGAAKPIFPGVLGAVTLSPSKLSSIAVYTEEMVASSAIEQIVREALSHDLSALLDTAIFDAVAASATRPAGLFNGATAVTASAAAAATEAMIADLRALSVAVAGTANPDAAATTVFVMHPNQALRVNLTTPQQYQNIIVSAYVAPGAVGAIDTSAIAMIVGQPVFQVSRDASLHMDSAAAALALAGATVISSPTRSLFQEDLIGLRSVLKTGWIKRRATATALASSVLW